MRRALRWVSAAIRPRLLPPDGGAFRSPSFGRLVSRPTQREPQGVPRHRFGMVLRTRPCWILIGSTRKWPNALRGYCAEMTRSRTRAAAVHTRRKGAAFAAPYSEFFRPSTGGLGLVGMAGRKGNAVLAERFHAIAPPAIFPLCGRLRSGLSIGGRVAAPCRGRIGRLSVPPCR
jgi:hypothetical protein